MLEDDRGRMSHAVVAGKSEAVETVEVAESRESDRDIATEVYEVERMLEVGDVK